MTTNEIITGLDYYVTFGINDDGIAIAVIRDNDDGEIVEVVFVDAAGKGRSYVLAIINS